MSSWWDISFSVSGNVSEIEKFENALPSLFHRVISTDRLGGMLVAQVAQNYGGGAAIEAAMATYSNLMFNGMLFHQSTQEGSGYDVFCSIDGEVAWREFILQDCTPEPVTPQHLDEQIEQFNRQIERLKSRRDDCLRDRANCKVVESERQSEPGVDGDVASQEDRRRLTE